MDRRAFLGRFGFAMAATVPLAGCSWGSIGSNDGSAPTETLTAPPVPSATSATRTDPDESWERDVSRAVTIPPGEFASVRLELPSLAVFRWTITGDRSESFDVFTFTRKGFAEYRNVVDGGSGNPAWLSDGTERDVRVPIAGSTPLRAGGYVFVLDNTAFGIAGSEEDGEAVEVTIDGTIEPI